MAKHNKKRNVGLLYEQLMKFACNSIVDDNTPAAKKAVDIICNRFKPGTALYREFRLFNALVNSRVEERYIARRIIEESRQASKEHNRDKLRKEKSQLIKEINHSLNDAGFYNQKLEKYRTYATVQALLNEWRGAALLAPEEIVEYEKGLEDWLVRKPIKESTIKKEHANPLTLNIMIDKFRKKYDGRMNAEQRGLLESYLFDESDVVAKIVKIKSRASEVMKEYFGDCDNKILNSKKELVKNQIESLEEKATPDVISRAMVLSSLASEMEV